jgi:hypothetical protein
LQGRIAELSEQVAERTAEIRGCGEEIVRLRIELQKSKEENRKLRHALNDERGRLQQVENEVRTYERRCGLSSVSTYVCIAQVDSVVNQVLGPPTRVSGPPAELLALARKQMTLLATTHVRQRSLIAELAAKLATPDDDAKVSDLQKVQHCAYFRLRFLNWCKCATTSSANFGAESAD